MTTVWTHPEHKVLSAGRYGQGRYRSIARQLRERTAVQCAAISQTSPQHSALIVSFILLSLIALVLSVGIIVVNIKSAWVEVRSMIVEEEFDSGTVASKAEFLRNLDELKKRELASQIHFVTQIINERRVKTDARSLAKEIVLESYRSGFDPLLTTSIILSESAFNNQATSHKGARGLMQLIPSTAQHVTKLIGFEWFGTHKLHESGYNIKLGIAYMQHLLGRYKGDLRRSLIAYNWGPGNVDEAVKAGRVPPLGPIRYADGIISRQLEWAQNFDQRQAAYKFINPEIILG